MHFSETFSDKTSNNRGTISTRKGLTFGKEIIYSVLNSTNLSLDFN